MDLQVESKEKKEEEVDSDIPTNYTLLCTHTYCSPDITIKIESHPKLNLHLRLGFEPQEPELLRIVAADSGLLLSCELSSSRQAYYVSNPSNGHWTALPEPPTRTRSLPQPQPLYSFPYNNQGFLGASASSIHDNYQVFILDPGNSIHDNYLASGNSIHNNNQVQPRALGFTAGPGSLYKVFRIQDFDHKTLHLDSFDSGTRRWRSSKVNLSHPVVQEYDRLVPGVLYKGALHWAVESPHSSWNKIVAYDPAKHESQGEDYTCRVFDCSPICGNFRDGCLGLSGGEMRYADLTMPETGYFVSMRYLCVWSLRDYDSEDWCLEHKIFLSSEKMTMAGLPMSYDHAYVWGFNPVDKDIVYFCFTVGGRGVARSKSLRSKTLASYSISAQSMTHLCTHNELPLPYYYNRNPSIIKPTHSAVPFVIPSCPTPL